jgi:hypothetical protein
VTQPQPPSSNAKIIAAAALGLALIALEQQVSDKTRNAVEDATTVIAAAAVAAAATAPLSGVALLTLLNFHTILTTSLGTAKQSIRDTVDSGYQAATRLTLTQLAGQLDHTPDTLPALGTARDTLLRDVDTMIGHAQTDIQNRIQAAYDNTTSGPSARIVAVHTAVTDATTALSDRATKAATTAVHRAATDTQQAVYADYQQHTGTPGLMKRWRTTSNQPCGMCEALNGTVVGINADFDARATTRDKDLRPAWRNLSGPPRHPHCRCQLELVQT